MTQATCLVSAQSCQNPDAIWPQVKDLRRPWHPLVADEQWQLGDQGQIQSRFTTRDDDSVYVEQQTFVSHSLHWLGYRMLEGIKGIDSYHAWLEINQRQTGGSELRWQATINAPEALAKGVAQGSESILQMAVDALANLPNANPKATATKPYDACPIEKHTLAGTPQLAVRSAGLNENTSTLMVFLHGIGGQASNWDSQLQQIGHLIPCAALDLRGYGNSDLGPEATSLEDYFADILRLKNYFKADKLIICGLSYGAWIATSFASQYPELVQGLIASGGCTGMSEAPQEERQAFLQARQVPLSQGLTPKDFAPNVVKVIAGNTPSEEQQNLLFESMAAVDSATYADALQCFCNPPATIDFSAIRCPMLFMTGDQDPLASATEITHLAKRTHQLTLADQGPAWIQLEILQNCGHVANVLQPQYYNHYLIEFVQRCLPA